LNGQAHGVIDQIPNAVIVDPYCATVAQQWAAHQAKLARLGQPSRRLTANQFITALQKLQQHYVDHLLANRIVKVTREGWFLANRSAIRVAWQMRLAQSRVNQRLSQRQTFLTQNRDARQTVPLDLQIQTFQRLRALETSHRDLRLGKWVFLVTLGLFILLAIGLPQTLGTFKSWDLFLLLGVLLIHELGHFLAMRLFGYQDTKLFFLPLFGAAVTGRKPNASLTEKIWVLLAGPLPGLILGLGLMAGVSAQLLPLGNLDPKLVEHAAWMLISLNLLNLLPIYPLDGGKIANHLLFSRYPWTDVLFKGLTVLLFGLCSSLSPTFLILVIGTAISIPNSYRIAKLHRVIQQKLAAGKPHHQVQSADLLPIVFQEMQSAGYGQLPWGKRDTIAKELLDRQREQVTSATSRWGLAGIYAGSLILALVGTVAAVTPQIPVPIAAAPSSPREFQQAFRQADRQIQRQPRSAAAHFHRARLYEQRHAQSQRQVATVATPVSYSQSSPPQSSSTQSAPTQSAPTQSAPTQSAPTQSSLNPSASHDLRQALADYDRAIALDPNQAASYQARAHLKRLLGQPAAALNDYTALIRLNPQDATLYSDRAELHIALGQPQAAIQDATTALQLNPNQPDVYQIRAQAKQAIGDRAGSQADQQQATRLWQALN
jgi:Zn-dependent protease